MSIEFKASKRDEQGSGASRRLRRAGQIPAIIYGGSADALAVTLDHNELYHMLKKEAFHSSILNIDVAGSKESVVLRDVQWHAYRPIVMHLDFQRVDATHKIHMKVPLHFINAEIAPGVKEAGGIVSHVLTELEVSCLPGNLPEYVTVDLKSLAAGAAIHASQLDLPAGVEVLHGDSDPVVASIAMPQGGAEEAPAAPEAGGEA